MKYCKKCKKTKPFSEFYRRSDGKENTLGGYVYLCKPCDNKRSNARRKNGGWKNEKLRQGPGTKHAENSKKNSKRHRDEMSDMYIRSLIVKKDKDLKEKDVTNDMVEVCRMNLAIKRKLRE